MLAAGFNKRYYLSLGSNLGDRQAHLSAAIHFLKRIGKVLAESSIYETIPVEMPGETDPFLNMAVSFGCNLEPETLLKEIKYFESVMGRDVNHSHNLPRTVDIDILLMDTAKGSSGLATKLIRTPTLEIPHPRLTERGFVLVPLSEIAPDVIHPVRQQTIAQLLAELKQPDQGIKKVLIALS